MRKQSIPWRGAAAVQAGFDYQLYVSILAALQLLLILKAATCDLLERGHPGRQLLTAARPILAPILDDLGEVQLREAVRKRLGDHIAIS